MPFVEMLWCGVNSENDSPPDLDKDPRGATIEIPSSFIYRLGALAQRQVLR